MENNSDLPAKQVPPEDLPSLMNHSASETIAVVDHMSCQSLSSGTASPRADAICSKRSEVTIIQSPQTELDVPYHISISMSASPSGIRKQQTKGIMFSDKSSTSGGDKQQNHDMDSTVINIQLTEQGKSLSDSITSELPYNETFAEEIVLDSLESQQKMPRYNARPNDRIYDCFKTWSGRLQRQVSALHGRPQEPNMEEANIAESVHLEPMLPVDRYFAALEGPELETLRTSEKLVLPQDKLWPFLLRFPISCFSVSLGISSQAILWKSLAINPSVSFLHISLTVNLVLWWISLAFMVLVTIIYSLKIIFYFEAIKREYYHPVRVNFFFAPWVGGLLLAAAVPPSIATHPPKALWYVLMAPILCLELKIYGQWMLGGERRLSKVANPTSHLSIAGNFVGAYLGPMMGLKQGPLFFFAVGLAHYIVLFVTLYQRLPSNDTLPKELHPVYFLFVAAPSIGSVAWSRIQGDFDDVSKILYFLAIFLYMSMAVRINFFRGFKFSLAWWAYELPMTSAALSTIAYANKQKSWVTQSMSVVFSCIPCFAILALLVSTIFHAFVKRDVFPNDIPIAITSKRSKSSKKSMHLKPMSSDTRDLQAYVAPNAADY